MSRRPEEPARRLTPEAIEGRVNRAVVLAFVDAVERGTRKATPMQLNHLIRQVAGRPSRRTIKGQTEPLPRDLQRVDFQVWPQFFTLLYEEGARYAHPEDWGRFLDIRDVVFEELLRGKAQHRAPEEEAVRSMAITRALHLLDSLIARRVVPTHREAMAAATSLGAAGPVRSAIETARELDAEEYGILAGATELSQPCRAVIGQRVLLRTLNERWGPNQIPWFASGAFGIGSYDTIVRRVAQFPDDTIANTYLRSGLDLPLAQPPIIWPEEVRDYFVEVELANQQTRYWVGKGAYQNRKSAEFNSEREGEPILDGTEFGPGDAIALLVEHCEELLADSTTQWGDDAFTFLIMSWASKNGFSADDLAGRLDSRNLVCDVMRHRATSGSHHPPNPGAGL